MTGRLRVALAALFAASAATFAVGLPSRSAWLISALVVVSMGMKPRGLRPGLVTLFVLLLQLTLGATVIYGWMVMVYPILSAGQMRFYGLLFGYSIGCLGLVFFGWDAKRTPWATVVPAALGLLVVSSFDSDAPIQPYLVAAGITGLACLVVGVPRDPRSAKLRALGALFLVGVSSAAISAGIVFLLPWAQDRLEEVMLGYYTPLADDPGARNRSRLGELQSLKLSSEVVMRVWSERPQRLRTRALVRFDGRVWHRDSATLRILEPDEALSGLEPSSRQFLLDLPGSDFVPDPGTLSGQRLIQTRILWADGDGLATPGGTRLVRAGLPTALFDPAGLVVAPPASGVRLYGVLHELNHQKAFDEVASPATIEASLQLPDRLDPRVPALAREMASGVSDRKEIVARIVSRLRDDYTYSLDIGDIDAGDPIADFLLRKRKGWCEYFAGAAVILLRSEGIPARYVQGFNVIGSQKRGDHYVVRDWDRHAWIEVYFDSEGWLEYDPTPAAEYESLHAGLEEGSWEEWLEPLRARLASFFARASYFRPTELLGPLLIATILLGLGYLAVRLARFLPRWFPRIRGKRRRPATGIELLARDLDRALEELGLARPKSRAPLEHWARLSEEKLPAGLKELASRIIASHYRSRYGGVEAPPEETTKLGEQLRSFSLPGSSSALRRSHSRYTSRR